MSHSHSTTLRIAIAGLGTVGAETFRTVIANRDLLTARSGREIQVVAVSARDRNKARDLDLKNVTWHNDATELAELANVDAIVELIGGEDGVALTLCTRALENKKSVITANKAMLAKHGVGLAKIAEKHHIALQFEAAVAGGIPIIKTLKEGLAGNRIHKVLGILNGTCNYILTTMEKDGLAFADVLREAQALGYAEADPTFDVEGIDAAHKVTLLTALAYGVKPDFSACYIEGITGITLADIDYAAELGYRIRLLGQSVFRDGEIEQRIHPCLVKIGSPLASVDGVLNAVQTHSSPVRSLFMEGPGAGAGPTASAVVADIVEVARGHFTAPFGVPAAALTTATFRSIDACSGSYYLRLLVRDVPGVLASITAALSKESIGVESVLQKPLTVEKTKAAQLALTTHTTTEAAMRSAVAVIAKADYTLEAPHVIRIEQA